MKTMTNDEIRRMIINFIYEKRKKARSLKSLAVRPSELKRELKKLGLTENQIVTNLDFLIANGWIKEQVERYTLPRKRVEVKRVGYRLSDIALHYFERSSTFNRTGAFSGINFQNIRDSIIIVGTGLIIQKNYYDLYEALDDLRKAISLTDMTEEDKRDYLADIETIKLQLAKPYPEKSIIKTAWEKISTLSKLGGLATLIEKIYNLIKIFL
ncbi:MAG: hypothetical protein ACUVTD_09245 [Nitrososphaerales archaeon]